MADNVKKGGEDVFKEAADGVATDVNQGHNLASAPVYEFGGKNPKDMKK